LRLLEDDALGGHGSRGYGQVKVEIHQILARKLEDYRRREEATGGEKVITDLSQLDELWEHFGS